ncbi:DUF4913 domain-containing protein [Nocardia takedensis]|uniref:DUF4913 domain-containing protein n=1 Tax=Nocardia takedensis TaxID=259390 RepID=UPI00031AA590|nr:DUF4913 domain-containing protein [Nocardia takedensis]
MSDDEIIEPVFTDVTEFVGVFLVQIYQRQVSDSSDTVWCEQWWRHPEAVARLDALWRAWERLQRDERAGLSIWLLDYADKHMGMLLNPRGPFKYCSVRHGHVERIQPLPCDPPPAGHPTERLVGLPKWVYPSVDSFVREYLSEVFRRPVIDVSDAVWCPQWWRHPEAVLRLEALWRAWEHLRNEASTGLSEWITEHADMHLALLFNPKGPFKYCDARGGHRSNPDPLPVASELEGMFSNPVQSETPVN